MNKRGQYMPITAMVLFTSVIFLVAVVNIYKITRAKLKVQNLADATALNIASQMASSMNKMTDLNEWMNHFVDQGPNQAPSKPGEVPNCTGINEKLLPPLACAENTVHSPNLWMFPSKDDASAYGTLVQRINEAQDMFATTYNNFIGAGTAANANNANGSLHSILLNDIPQLGDPGTRVIVYNTASAQIKLAQTKSAILADAASTPAGSAPRATLDTSGMQQIKYATHDVTVGYWKVNLFGKRTAPQYVTLGQIVTGHNPPSDSEHIGWKELDDQKSPFLKVSAGAGSVQRIGTGAMVIRTVYIPIIGSVPVVGNALAYVVAGSGQMGAAVQDPSSGVPRPIFKPTFWVKLVGTQS